MKNKRLGFPRPFAFSPFGNCTIDYFAYIKNRQTGQPAQRHCTLYCELYSLCFSPKKHYKGCKYTCVYPKMPSKKSGRSAQFQKDKGRFEPPFIFLYQNFYTYSWRIWTLIQPQYIVVDIISNIYICS